MSKTTDAVCPATRWRRLALNCAILLLALAVGFPLLAGRDQKPAAAAASSFGFNWMQAPSTPLDWTPGQVNDWDLVENIDGPTDNNGTMQAGHGPDCSAPPATHTVVSLADSAYICKDHMMTAVNGGGNAFVTYGAIYFAPAQLADWSQGPAAVSWKVSTERLSTRDWWQVNLTPFSQNMVLPLMEGFPAYAGEPVSGIQLRVDNGTCRAGNIGTIIRVSVISGSHENEITQNPPCVEDAVSPSAATRSQFQIDVSSGHLKVSMPGSNLVWFDGPVNLGFNQAVVQFSHHSYNPLKGADVTAGGTLGPNTYHWSDVGISPATPFTMLRPQQPFSLHEGQNPVLNLPQAAPQGSFLRFAGLGNFEASYDGGKTYQAARVQGDNSHPEHFASYWTPVPAGTTQVMLKGQINGSNYPWWVEDVSVWSQTFNGIVSAPPPVSQPTPTPQPTATPKPSPTSTPASTPTPTPTPTQTSSSTPTPTPTQTSSSTPTPTATPTSTPKPTPTPTPTSTPKPTPTPTPPVTGPPPPPPGSGVAFRSASRSIYFAAARRPANLAQGDLLLASLEVDADPVKVSPPPGWTLLSDTKVASGTRQAFHALTYYKVAGANEPAYYEFNRPWGVWSDLQVLDYSGVDPKHPIDAIAARDAGRTSTPATPAITTRYAGDRLVTIFIDHDFARFSAPAGLTERMDFDGNTSDDGVLGAAGSVAPRTAQASESGPMGAIAVALKRA
jgi:hypothetical protein